MQPIILAFILCLQIASAYNAIKERIPEGLRTGLSKMISFDADARPTAQQLLMVSVLELCYVVIVRLHASRQCSCLIDEQSATKLKIPAITFLAINVQWKIAIAAKFDVEKWNLTGMKLDGS